MQHPVTDLLGLVPQFTPEEIADALNPGELALFHAATTGMTSGGMQFGADLDADTIRSLMQKLNVAPVWGRSGLHIFRLRVGDRIPVFAIAPDPMIDPVPQRILERNWVVFKSLDAMIQAMMEYAATARSEQETGDPRVPRILAEDHPEEGCIGFIAPAANTVWMIQVEDVAEGLKSGSGYALASTLILSNEGRVELGLRIARGQLMTAEEAMDSYQQLQSLTPNATLAQKRADEEVTINLMTGRISKAYQSRYMSHLGQKGGS